MSVNKPFYYSMSNDKKEDEKLKPITYIHRFRKIPMQSEMKLPEIFNYWLKVPKDKLQTIIEIMNISYYKVIIDDDIQDNSNFRGDVPIIHSVFGFANTINALNYMLMIAFEKIMKLQHAAAMKIYTEQMMIYIKNYKRDIFWRNNFNNNLSEAEYKIIIEKKMSAIFNIAVRLMKLFSSYQEDLSPLINILALYFQTHDDYCNLCLVKHTRSKTYYEHLTKGKLSIPIIHAIMSNPDDVQLIKIELKHYCIELLEKNDSFNYTRCLLDKLDKAARTEIDRLGGNPILVKILDAMKNRYKQA